MSEWVTDFVIDYKLLLKVYNYNIIKKLIMEAKS